MSAKSFQGIAIRHRAGLIGAGGICPHHVAALRALPGVEIVGVTDRNPERARALAAELGLRPFPSLGALVDAGADVIHVLTPPESHAALAIEAIERGCHVLVEKPFAENEEDAEAVRAAARARGTVVSVDHSLLFEPLVASALADVHRGKIGRVVSVDILRGSAYPPYPGGKLPPQYLRAGYPFRDLGVHGLYLLQALLGDIEDVTGAWRSFGGDRNLAFDEWRALVRCRDGIGQLQLTWNAKPIQHQIFIHGTRGVLRLDLFALFRSTRRALPLPGAAQRMLGGLSDIAEPLLHMTAGVLDVASGRRHPYQGLRGLVAAFYRHLDDGGPPPVDLQDAIRTVRWTEHIARAAERDLEQRLSPALPSGVPAPYLVTGASGALGGAVVQRLLARGDRVRVFMRRPPAELPPGVELVLGDLGDGEAVSRAVDGVSTVIHVGAAMTGGWNEHRVATVEGTRHVLDACRRHGVSKLVHISSMSVVQYAGDTGGVVDEQTPLEPRPEARGAYTRAKLEAERLVRAAASEGLPAVILRPGQIFGGRIPLLTPAVARRLPRGAWLVLGDGEAGLPLVYLDDVVDAVVLAVDGELKSGEVIQITDETMTQNEVLAAAGGGLPVVHVPRALLLSLGKLSEPLFEALGRTSPVGAYRLQSALAHRSFEPRNAGRLGWRPGVGVRAGMAKTMGATAPPTSPPPFTQRGNHHVRNRRLHRSGASGGDHRGRAA